MFAILIIIICFYGTQCEDICIALKPNGTYDRVMAYMYFRGSSHTPELWMYNQEFEWRIDLSFDSKDSADVLYVENTTTSITNATKLKFSTYDDSGQDYVYNCLVYKEEDNEIVTKCSCDYVSLCHIKNDYKNQYNPDVVIAFSAHTKKENHYYVLLLDRFNRTIEYYSYHSMDKTINCDDECIPPMFVAQIPRNMTIDGITNYFDEGGGHLLVYNVNSIPKYCITPANQNLSDECKDETKLKILFPICFGGEHNSSTTLRPPHTAIFIWIWILLVFGIVVMFCLCWLSIVYVYRKYYESTAPTVNNISSSESTGSSIDISEQSKAEPKKHKESETPKLKLTNETKATKSTNVSKSPKSSNILKK